jgi:predicted ATP-binding protein involved in virulence
MERFKILAIRALGQTSNHVLKALKVNTLYKFYQNYNFQNALGNEVVDGSEVTLIRDNKENYKSIFSVRGDQNIFISAIVGKNGSGKSSLNELVYLLNFLISSSIDLNMIDSIDPLTRSNFSHKSTPERLKDIENLKTLFKDTYLELYYENEKTFERFIYQDDSVKREKLINGSWILDKINKLKPSKQERRKHILSEFCYTVAINYSIYGLNGAEEYWLNPLFHKNDGYQIPIVINPYREEGNININSEQHLAQSRLLSNLSANRNREIVNDKKISAVKLLIVPEYIDSIQPHSMYSILKVHKEKNNLNFFQFFDEIAKAIFGKKLLSKSDVENLQIFLSDIDNPVEPEKFSVLNYKLPTSELAIKYFLIKYVVRKVFKICVQQNEYRMRFLDKDSQTNFRTVFSLENLSGVNGLYKTLARDNSHVTLKLRQALHCIKDGHFFNSWKSIANPSNPEHIAFETKVAFSNYQKVVNGIIENNPKLNKESLEAIPNALFRPTILVKRGASRNVTNESGFKQLSSGEQQYINIFQTAIYHLRNLNSVHECGDNNKIAYRNVNLIFDEIELYFHPEFQQIFIFELREAIRRTKLTHIKSINILFCTHSPFILSDIPSENILKLKDGEPEPYETSNKTFGANIHDLLANEFFLRKGFMGEFAKEFISKLLSEIESIKPDEISHEKYSEIRSKVNLIGEPVIENSIKAMLDNKFPKPTNLLVRRAELEKEIKLIDQKLAK